ncbi:DUF4179 domain-containing protein [Robertmurraya sp. Marseille-Q9965]
MEKKLEDYINNVEVPEEKLDDAIFAGFQKAKSEKVRLKGKKWWLSVAAVAILLVGFSGIEKIYELIRDDKGMLSALEHEYYEELGVSDKKNGIEFVIDGAIADESRLILFYTVNTDKKQKEIRADNVEIKNLDQGTMDISSFSDEFYHQSDTGEKSYNGKIEYTFNNPLTAKNFQLDLEIKGDSEKEEFSVNFNLKNEFKEKKIYSIDKTVTLEGQKIHFVDVRVYPLRVGVHFKLDPNNTKKILQLEDLQLVDENGETWLSIMNGLSAIQVTEGEYIYYLQSNYFKEPKELYLVFNRVQAVDKEYSHIVVDMEKKEILKQPKGNMLRDLEVSRNQIGFKLYTEKAFPYGIFAEVKDANGKSVDYNTSFWDSYHDGYSSMWIRGSNFNRYANPLTFELTAFPEWIQGKTKIRIK